MIHGSAGVVHVTNTDRGLVYNMAGKEKTASTNSTSNSPADYAYQSSVVDPGGQRSRTDADNTVILQQPNTATFTNQVNSGQTIQQQSNSSGNNNPPPQITPLAVCGPRFLMVAV